MAIYILPPVPFTNEERADIAVLLNIVITFAAILDRESAIPPSGNTMTPTSISSLNTTLTDASDRIDAIINPTILP